MLWISYMFGRVSMRCRHHLWHDKGLLYLLIVHFWKQAKAHISLFLFQFALMVTNLEEMSVSAAIATSHRNDFQNCSVLAQTLCKGSTGGTFSGWSLWGKSSKFKVSVLFKRKNSKLKWLVYCTTQASSPLIKPKSSGGHMKFFQL